MFIQTMEVIDLHLIDEELFYVRAANGANMCETLCRLHSHKNALNEVNYFEVLSDEFNVLMMNGHIQISDIRKALKGIS